MARRKRLASLAIGLPLLSLAAVAAAQQPTGGVDAEYIKTAMTAGPREVADNASIVRMVNGVMRTVKKGTNEYTCMVMIEGPMCTGRFGMEWVQAWQAHTPPPDQLGFVYMLGGDSGSSNTDPWATKPEPGNHWIRMGAHVMLVGPGVKKMEGFPRTPDPDPTKPYVMWPGTPYEHVMLPVSPTQR